MIVNLLVCTTVKFLTTCTVPWESLAWSMLELMRLQKVCSAVDGLLYSAMAPLQVPVFGAGLRSGRQQCRQQRASIPNASRQQRYNHYENGHGLWVRCSPSVSSCAEACKSDVHARLKTQALRCTLGVHAAAATFYCTLTLSESCKI